MEAVERHGLVAVATDTGEALVFRHEYETRFEGGVETRRIDDDRELTLGYDGFATDGDWDFQTAELRSVVDVPSRELERIEDNIYRGDSRDIGSPQVFGGQVLGQALSAAQLTVEGRVAHSLNAYFLRRGDISAPIIYEVDRQRDGGANRHLIRTFDQLIKSQLLYQLS